MTYIVWRLVTMRYKTFIQGKVNCHFAYTHEDVTQYNSDVDDDAIDNWYHCGYRKSLVKSVLDELSAVDESVFQDGLSTAKYIKGLKGLTIYGY